MNLHIVTAYTSDFATIGDASAASIRQYARRHTFEFLVESKLESHFVQRPPSWYCIHLLSRLFENGIEWVLWLDADAAFVRYDADIRSVVQADKHLYLVQHETTEGPAVPNAGVMLFRNCSWTRELLRDIWNMEQYIHHKWWENAAIMHVMGYFALLGIGPDVVNHAVADHVCNLPGEWNSIPGVCQAANPIIVHYAGHDQETRKTCLPSDVARGLSLAKI